MFSEDEDEGGKDDSDMDDGEEGVNGDLDIDDGDDDKNYYSAKENEGDE